MTTPRTEEEALALAESFLELQQRVKKLEEGSRASKLAHSSLDLASGRGYIPLIEKGLEKGRIGRQPDGTTNLVFANDDTPPPIPLVPELDAGLGTITVTVTGLTNNEIYNFSHVRVYVNGQQDGTITKLPGTWIVGPLDDGDHVIEVTSVSVAGAESAKTAPQIASPDQVVIPPSRDFVANPIQRTEILDGAINTPKLAANAVEANQIATNAITALKVAANAITATKIQAGAVSADKLEALLVIANRLVAGDPNGRNYSIDENGMAQYDEMGQILTAFGANPAGGNFLTFVDPDDTQRALAAIDNGGNIVGQNFAVARDLNIGGESLINNLNALPRGIIEWGNTATNSGFTTSEVGIMELDVDIDPTRHYRISTNTGFLNTTNENADAETRLHFTINGSRPTISSPIMEISARARGFGGPMRISCTFDGARCPGGRLRLLYSIVSLGNSIVGPQNIQLVCPAGNVEANDLQIWVEDIGPRRGQTGASSSGGGSTTAPVSNYTIERPASWSQSFNTASSPVLSQGAYNSQGISGSLIGFPDGDFRNALDDSTITSVEFYLYANHWWYNGGGTVRLVAHNWSARSSGGYSIGSWPGLNRGESQIATYRLGKPEGRWVTLPNWVGEQMRDNQLKGIALSAPNTSLEYYGKFDNHNLSGAEPALRIKYRK